MADHFEAIRRVTVEFFDELLVQQFEFRKSESVSRIFGGTISASKQEGEFPQKQPGRTCRFKKDPRQSSHVQLSLHLSTPRALTHRGY